MSISDMMVESETLNREVVESKALMGRECLTCNRVLEFKFFRRDSSYREGYREQCMVCEAAPIMSTSEHTHRLRELNYAAAAKQRWAHQDDYRNDESRTGRIMHSAELILWLKRLVPDLFFTEGRIEGDLAVYRTYGGPQDRLGGMSFEYLFFLPTGFLPEFSTYCFDEVRDVLIKEKQRGWRTVLLRLIRSGLITEEKVNEVFGPADGPGATVYLRKLWEHRNAKLASS